MTSRDVSTIWVKSNEANESLYNACRLRFYASSRSPFIILRIHVSVPYSPCTIEARVLYCGLPRSVCWRRHEATHPRPISGGPANCGKPRRLVFDSLCPGYVLGVRHRRYSVDVAGGNVGPRVGDTLGRSTTYILGPPCTIEANQFQLQIQTPLAGRPKSIRRPRAR
jgi:hypothetical protein